MVKMGKMFGSKGLAVVCDGCGRKLWVGNVAFVSEGLDKARKEGWKTQRGNDQCPDCRGAKHKPEPMQPKKSWAVG